MAEATIAYRRLELEDLALIRDIDRTEHIDALYLQHGAELELRIGDDWSAPAWSRGPPPAAPARVTC